jgi:hypothetical protein
VSAGELHLFPSQKPRREVPSLARLREIRAAQADALEVPDYLAMTTEPEPPLVSGKAQGYELTKPTEAPELRRNAAFVSFGGATPCPFPKIEASSAWPPCSSCGRTSGLTFTDTDPVNRCPCGEPRPAPPPPVCLDCRRPVTPSDLLCDTCFQARKVIPFEELARRREERRQRTIAGLTRVPCGTCGKTRWHVNARGDAFCLECFGQGRNVR